MAKTLPGYRALGGTARRYETPSGATISRREYEDRKFRASGWGSWRDYQERSNDPNYNRWLRNAAEKYGESVRSMRAAGSDYNRFYLAARDAGFSSRDRSPTGTFARFLTFTGDRPGTIEPPSQRETERFIQETAADMGVDLPDSGISGWDAGDFAVYVEGEGIDFDEGEWWDNWWEEWDYYDYPDYDVGDTGEAT